MARQIAPRAWPRSVRHCNITGAMGVDRTYRGHHKIDAHYPFETSSKSDPAGLLSGSMLC
jgi:hypothetical protein